MMIISIVGFLVAILLGMIITRKGLQPLKEITQKVKNISSQRLNQRIGSKSWPHELAGLAASFDDMLNRLEDSFRRLKQFSADLAHELRTPIHNLIGETEVALNQKRNPDEYRRVLESNMEEYQQLINMIESLLFLARADKTEIDIHKKRTNLQNMLSEIVDFYSPLCEERHLSIKTQLKGWGHADPDLFRRAVHNVVSNAVKATPDHGEIVLKSKSDDSKCTRIEITDTGLGISPKDMPHIFDRFYRADTSRTGDDSGTGLGLSIVKTIMNLHGGKVTIHSKPGQGTKVQLIFPLNGNS